MSKTVQEEIQGEVREFLKRRTQLCTFDVGYLLESEQNKFVDIHRSNEKKIKKSQSFFFKEIVDNMVTILTKIFENIYSLEKSRKENEEKLMPEECKVPSILEKIAACFGALEEKIDRNGQQLTRMEKRLEEMHSTLDNLDSAEDYHYEKTKDRLNKLEFISDSCYEIKTKIKTLETTIKTFETQINSQKYQWSRDEVKIDMVVEKIGDFETKLLQLENNIKKQFAISRISNSKSRPTEANPSTPIEESNEEAAKKRIRFLEEQHQILGNSEKEAQKRIRDLENSEKVAQKLNNQFRAYILELETKLKGARDHFQSQEEMYRSQVSPTKILQTLAGESERRFRFIHDDLDQEESQISF